MADKNKVIAGDYKDWIVWYYSSNTIHIKDKSGHSLMLNKNTIEQYEIITEEKRKSGTSAIFRGAAGTAILGPVGILAGLTAKNKGTYTIAVAFKSGKRSLICMDDKFYKIFLKNVF